MFKKGGLFIFLILIGGAVFFWIRFFTVEDLWLCQNNEWVKHGNPSTSKPTSGCGENMTIKKTDQVSPITPNESEKKPTALPPLTAPQQVSLTGLYVCLPARSTGPQTEGCALGLMTDDQNYFALKTDRLDSYIMYPTGTRLRVFGQFIPIEMDSTMIGKKYNVKGIINLDKVEEIE
jgi:hypothetical protein